MPISFSASIPPVDPSRQNDWTEEMITALPIITRGAASDHPYPLSVTDERLA
jgi:hypothetical protein